MSTNQLQARVSQALNAKSASLQGHALATVINEIEDYVQSFNEDLELIREIDSMQRTESDLRSKLRANPDDEDAKREHREVEELLRQAQQLKSHLRGRTQVITHLKRDVQDLTRELSKTRT